MYNHKYVTFEVSAMVRIMVVMFCILVPYAFLPRQLPTFQKNLLSPTSWLEDRDSVFH